MTCSSSTSAATPTMRRGPLLTIDEIHHWIGPHDVPVERVLAWEHALRDALADDDDRLAAAAIVVVEVASFDNRNA